MITPAASFLGNYKNQNETVLSQSPQIKSIKQARLEQFASQTQIKRSNMFMRGVPVIQS